MESFHAQPCPLRGGSCDARITRLVAPTSPRVPLHLFLPGVGNTVVPMHGGLVKHGYVRKIKKLLGEADAG